MCAAWISARDLGSFFFPRVTWYKSVFIKKLSATYTEVGFLWFINLRSNDIRFGCSDLLEDRTGHPAVTASLTCINCGFCQWSYNWTSPLFLIQTGVKLIDLKWPWLLPFQNWHTVVISVFVVSLLSHMQSFWSPQLFQESCFPCLLMYMPVPGWMCHSLTEQHIKASFIPT